MSYLVTPLPQRYLDALRQTGLDDLQQPVQPYSAKGGEPLRDVLRRATPGERILAASFSPFALPGPFHEYGPVYVLADASKEVQHTPLGEGASDYFSAQLTLRGYSADEHILDAQLIPAADAPQVIEQLFTNRQIAFIHARFPVYGCFACRIDRARA